MKTAEYVFFHSITYHSIAIYHSMTHQSMAHHSMTHHSMTHHSIIYVSHSKTSHDQQTTTIGKMPARAWPPFQPKEDKIEMIRTILKECKEQTPYSDSCTSYEFDLATSLLFNNVSGTEALDIHITRKRGHSQAMVAVGVMLTGGIGVDRDETLGMRYLDDATPVMHRASTRSGRFFSRGYR